MKKILTYVVVLIALGAALAKPKPPSKAEIEKRVDEILDMRGLTSAAHGDVAHRDDGHAEVAALHDSHVKEEIPDAHTQPVEPAQRQQPLIDFDEITLHLIIE